jgi:hypothetical protein
LTVGRWLPRPAGFAPLIPKSSALRCGLTLRVCAPAHFGTGSGLPTLRIETNANGSTMTTETSTALTELKTPSFTRAFVGFLASTGCLCAVMIALSSL